MPKIETLALALGRVLDDEAWACELGKRVCCWVEQYFSPETVGKQLRDFLLKQKVGISEWGKRQILHETLPSLS